MSTILSTSAAIRSLQPETRGNTLEWLAAILSLLVFITLSLRIYSRILFHRKLGQDDWMIFSAVVCPSVACMLFIPIVLTSFLGILRRHDSHHVLRLFTLWMGLPHPRRPFRNPGTCHPRILDSGDLDDLVSNPHQIVPVRFLPTAFGVYRQQI